jgi:hypothetical protein
VHPRARVADQALAIARDIAEATRESLVLLKRTFAARRGEALEHALAAEDAAHATLFNDSSMRDTIARRYPRGRAAEAPAGS